MKILATVAEPTSADREEGALLLALVARSGRSRLPTVFDVRKRACRPLVQVPFWKAQQVPLPGVSSEPLPPGFALPRGVPLGVPRSPPGGVRFGVADRGFAAALSFPLG